MVLGMVWRIPDADTLRHQLLSSSLAWGLARKHGSLQCSVQHGPWKAHHGATGSVATAASVEFSAPKLQICLGGFHDVSHGFTSPKRLLVTSQKNCFMKTQVHPKFRSECSLRILHIFWTSPFPSDVTVFRYRNFRSFPKGYLAGVTVDALVQLRDQFGNNRTSSSPTLLFQALVEGQLPRDSLRCSFFFWKWMMYFLEEWMLIQNFYFWTSIFEKDWKIIPSGELT